jgi:hypothetical protein
MFGKLNAQLSAMVSRGFEEETVVTISSILNPANETGFSGSFKFEKGSQSLDREDPLFLSLRSQVFQYNNDHFRVLRLIRGIPCDTIQRVNSDYGFQTHSEISFSFVFFIIFSFVAMEAKIDPSLAECENGSSCVRVVMDFCISCLCISKF